MDDKEQLDQLKHLVDRTLNLTEKVVTALGQNKGYIELQNKDMAAQLEQLKRVETELEKIFGKLDGVTSSTRNNDALLLAMKKDLDELKKKDEGLRKLFLWATVLAASVGGGLGAVVSFISKVVK